MRILPHQQGWSITASSQEQISISSPAKYQLCLCSHTVRPGKDFYSHYQEYFRLMLSFLPPIFFLFLSFASMQIILPDLIVLVVPSVFSLFPSFASMHGILFDHIIVLVVFNLYQQHDLSFDQRDCPSKTCLRSEFDYIAAFSNSISEHWNFRYVDWTVSKRLEYILVLTDLLKQFNYSPFILFAYSFHYSNLQYIQLLTFLFSQIKELTPIQAGLQNYPLRLRHPYLNRSFIVLQIQSQPTFLGYFTCTTLSCLQQFHVLMPLSFCQSFFEKSHRRQQSVQMRKQ